MARTQQPNKGLKTGARPGDGQCGERPGSGWPGDGQPAGGRPDDGRPGDGRPRAAADTAKAADSRTPKAAAKTPRQANNALKSDDFMDVLARQTVNALWRPSWKDEEESRKNIQAAIDAMKDIAPRNAAEGMLASQMVVTHNAAMDCLQRAMLANQPFKMRDANLKHAQRLSKLYLDQLAALDKHRGRGQQKITVEHVTVEAGGQAIVGAVDTGGAGATCRPHAETGRSAGGAARGAGGAARGEDAADGEGAGREFAQTPDQDLYAGTAPSQAARSAAPPRHRPETLEPDRAANDAAEPTRPKVRKRTRPKKPH